jgi:hypothetical protein
MFEEYTVTVPEGTAGDWEVRKITAPKPWRNQQWERDIGIVRRVPRGTYTALVHQNTIVMSDTPDEIRDHMEAIEKAQGAVLITGLGLGVVVQAMLRKPEVTNVTVIEKSPEVIALVAPHYQQQFGERLAIIQADAFTWQPPTGVRYAVVWHDIWTYMLPENLIQMDMLKRHYTAVADWQGFWYKEVFERIRDAERQGLQQFDKLYQAASKNVRVGE